MRVPWAASIDKCSDLGRTCNCLPYLKKSDKGNVWLAADGVRYNLEMDLDTYEKTDPIRSVGFVGVYVCMYSCVYVYLYMYLCILQHGSGP